MNFEQVPVKPNVDLGANTHIQVINNIFKIVGRVPIFWANQTANKAHLGIACALGNLYDVGGRSFVIANEDGSKLGNITTMGAWRASGFEVLHGVDYGIVADAGLLNVAGFRPPAGGFQGREASISSVRNFDLKPGSAAIGGGIDPWLSDMYIDLGSWSYRGAGSRVGSRVDVGASPYSSACDSSRHVQPCSVTDPAL